MYLEGTQKNELHLEIRKRINSEMLVILQLSATFQNAGSQDIQHGNAI
jgi:hypothetical protein